jgi:hypothetical protein
MNTVRTNNGSNGPQEGRFESHNNTNGARVNAPRVRAQLALDFALDMAAVHAAALRIAEERFGESVTREDVRAFVIAAFAELSKQGGVTL